MWSNPISTLRLWWIEATQITRIATAGIGFVLIVAMITWASLSARVYQVVFHNVSSSQFPAVEAILRDRHIPYRYAPQDSTVSVPSNNVDEASLAVEGAGVLTKTGDTSSADSLDKIGLMTSPEVEQQRILQSQEGNLVHVLSHLDHVQSASVTISPGTRGAMFGDEMPSTASVVLFLKPGEALAPQEIIGDRALIINAVPGLTANHMTLVDQSGTPLEATDLPMGQSLNQQSPATAQAQRIDANPVSETQVSPTVLVPPIPSKRVSAAWQSINLPVIGLIGFVLLCLVAIWLMRRRTGQIDPSSIGSELQIEPAASASLLTQTVPEVEVRTPFQFLSALPPDQIHDQLEREHPQTVAVILAQLPKAETSSLLAGLSDHCRTEVIPRMAALGELGPNVVRTVERALAHSLSQSRTGLTASPELAERAA